MERTVNRRLIDVWIKMNRPHGLDKLAQKSEIPCASISKMRQGRAPLNIHTRRRLAAALDVKESELFPEPTGKSRDS